MWVIINGMAAHLTRSDCKGFLEVCVSNAVDGTDDDVLWNGSEGDGNEMKALTVKMETVALFGKGRYNLMCFVY